jgi:hypothetical protein
MKNILLAVALITTCSVLAQETESRNIGSFKGIKVSEGIDVYLKKGEKESLKLEVSGVKPENVITEISGDYLKIHMDAGRYRSRSVKVYVTYVQLEKLSASSAANIFADGTIQSKSLGISASSAGTVDVTIEVDRLDVSASSAGDVELKGKAGRVDISASSAGEIDAYDLEAQVADIDVSSAGSAKISVVKEINAQASSGGSIRYRGSPSKTNTNSSSGGSVKKSN